jgi:hypothetical protein
MIAYLKRQIDNGVATIGTFFFEADGETHSFASLELP